MVRNLPANARNTDSVPGSGRCPGGGNGNPLQYSCLENSKDRGAWWAMVHGAAKESDMTERLSTHTHPVLRNFCIPLVAQMAKNLPPV